MRITVCNRNVRNLTTVPTLGIYPRESTILTVIHRFTHRTALISPLFSVSNPDVIPIDRAESDEKGAESDQKGAESEKQL